jgi:hypothetical protein
MCLTRHNMCLTRHNVFDTTQYVLDTTIYATNTDNINKTRALLQTTGGKDESNIVCMRKS